MNGVPIIPLLQAIVQEHSNDVRWGAHATAILNGAMWQPPRPGGHDDKAHPPIHPTRHSAGEADWAPGEWRQDSKQQQPTHLLCCADRDLAVCCLHVSTERVSHCGGLHHSSADAAVRRYAVLRCGVCCREACPV